MKVDYLIVGQGIAGSVMALTLERRGKSVAIMNRSELSSSSKIAAGVFNPMNFRKTQSVWRAKESLEALQGFYDYVEGLLEVNVRKYERIFRVIDSDFEAISWDDLLSPRRSLKPFPFFVNFPAGVSLESIKRPRGCATIVGGGIVDTQKFISAVQKLFSNRGYYINQQCDHGKLISTEKWVNYDNLIEASHVIFCEGHLARNNPLFDSRVVSPTKGELIHVSIPGFNQTSIINGPVYVAPIGDDKYVCGATFNPGKSDEEITEAGKEELIGKLKTMTDLPFEVIGHFAGVRPAGRDRKPVLGRSRTNRNFSIFNGFGSKAVLYSPFLAQMLADHLENGAELAPEINVARFKVY